MAENIQININAKDNASAVVKKTQLNLRELGEKTSQIGTRMSAAFTAPLVGMAMSINKFGTESVRVVADAQARLNEALSSGDTGKIAAARAEWDKIPASVRSAARSYTEMQQALAPVKTELQKIGAELLNVFVPVLKQAMPSIMAIVKSVGDLVTWFSNLSPATKTAIIGVIGFVGSLGPVIFIVGQVVGTIGAFKDVIGLLGLALPGASIATGGFASALGGLALTAAPIIALAGAIALLIHVINKFGGPAWTTFKQLLALGWRPFMSNSDWMSMVKQNGMVGKASGGAVGVGMGYMVNERGAEGYRNGNVLPTYSGRMAGAAAGMVVVNYSPTIGTASQDEIDRIGSLIAQALRRQR